MRRSAGRKARDVNRAGSFSAPTIYVRVNYAHLLIRVEDTQQCHLTQHNCYSLYDD